jgi:hypothetical protein
VQLPRQERALIRRALSELACRERTAIQLQQITHEANENWSYKQLPCKEGAPKASQGNDDAAYSRAGRGAELPQR